MKLKGNITVNRYWGKRCLNCEQNIRYKNSGKCVFCANELGRITSHKRRATIKKNKNELYTIEQLNKRFCLFDNRCIYCLKNEFITIDHFIPISKGGDNTLSNIVPACKSCNSSKNNSDPIEWMKKKGHSDFYIQNLLKLLEEYK